jgi:hypothetical protein
MIGMMHSRHRWPLLPVAHPTLALLVLCLGALTCQAHPVPVRNYLRTLVVRLTKDAVIVDYRLELDPSTAHDDLIAISELGDLAKLSKPRDFYEAFIDRYAPIFADNLVAKLDGQSLTFTCVQKEFQTLDHLRCAFQFRAPWQLRGGTRHDFRFWDSNYEFEQGEVSLTLRDRPPLNVLSKDEPGEALRAKTSRELLPGEDAKRRRASAIFSLPAPPPPAPTPAPPPEKSPIVPIAPEPVASVADTATPSPVMPALVLVVGVSAAVILRRFARGGRP